MTTILLGVGIVLGALVLLVLATCGFVRTVFDIIHWAICKMRWLLGIDKD